jgi:zinc-ribbon domain
MICQNCSTQNPDGAAFCARCGTVMSQQPTQVPGGPMTPPGQGPARAPASSFQFDINRLSTSDKIVAGASIIVLISVFLPWYGVFGFTISGERGHGYLFIPVLTAIAIVAYLVLRAGGVAMQLPLAHEMLLLIATGVQLLIVVIGFLNAEGSSQQFGAYLGLIAALAACGVVAWPFIQALQQRRSS